MANEKNHRANPIHGAGSRPSTRSFALRVAGCDVLWGDEMSIGVIFHRFTGRNFSCTTTHADYLAYMARELNTDLSDGVEVAWGTDGGTMLETAVIRRGASVGAEGFVCGPRPQGKTTDASAAPTMQYSRKPAL